MEVVNTADLSSASWPPDGLRWLVVPSTRKSLIEAETGCDAAVPKSAETIRRVSCGGAASRLRSDGTATAANSSEREQMSTAEAARGPSLPCTSAGFRSAETIPSSRAGILFRRSDCAAPCASGATVAKAEASCRSSAVARRGGHARP
eukprot:5533892-Pleurochrysis_carterae.AAC.2